METLTSPIHCETSARLLSPFGGMAISERTWARAETDRTANNKTRVIQRQLFMLHLGQDARSRRPSSETAGTRLDAGTRKTYVAPRHSQGRGDQEVPAPGGRRPSCGRGPRRSLEGGPQLGQLRFEFADASMQIR